MRNALAAIAVATEIGVERRRHPACAGRVLRWAGALSGMASGRLLAAAASLIDDFYGHHLVEMAAVLAAARGGYPAAPGAGVPAAPLHPHADCFADFVAVMKQADVVLLTEVSQRWRGAIDCWRHRQRAGLLAGQARSHFVGRRVRHAGQLGFQITRDGDVQSSAWARGR